MPSFFFWVGLDELLGFGRSGISDFGFPHISFLTSDDFTYVVPFGRHIHLFGRFSVIFRNFFCDVVLSDDFRIFVPFGRIFGYPCGLGSVIFRIVDDVVILLSQIYCVIYRSSFYCYSRSVCLIEWGFPHARKFTPPPFYRSKVWDFIFALDSACFALAMESSRFRADLRHVSYTESSMPRLWDEVQYTESSMPRLWHEVQYLIPNLRCHVCGMKFNMCDFKRMV